MIKPGDLKKPAHLRVEDEQYRSWKSLWLKKHTTYRVVWAGYISSVSLSMHGPTHIELEDSLERLRKKPWIT